MAVPPDKAPRIRHGAATFLALVYGALLLTPSVANGQNRATDWRAEGSLINSFDDQITEYLSPGAINDALIKYGRLLFNSPLIIGEKALRLGISCNSCHAKGHINRGFFITGLSDRPGHIDLSHAFWGGGNENNIFDPLPIPSLRGLRETAPYGSSGLFADIPSILHHVMQSEFASPKPDARQSRALTAYLAALRLPTAAELSKELSRQVKAADARPVLSRPEKLLKDALILLISALFGDDKAYTDMLVQLTRWQLGQVARLPGNSANKALYHDFARKLSLPVKTSPGKARIRVENFLRRLELRAGADQ